MEYNDFPAYQYATRLYVENTLRVLLNISPVPMPENNYPASSRLYSLHIGDVVVKGATEMGSDTDALLYLHYIAEREGGISTYVHYTTIFRSLQYSLGNISQWLAFWSRP